ncbi:MAG: YigZ family protein [Bacilli bacterium]|nr:YigZ family protein [Bacilli bacterium]MBN2877293.1 YigZ family protein [Bacilli bacterium]
MRSILTKTAAEIEVKKSRFIAVILPVSKEEKTKEILNEIRKEYPNANHYTYAYVLGEDARIQKASDDGEPTRTAGYPILEILLKNELTNCILIVIRYFGGTLLGTGGLIRAYSGAASEVLNQVIFTKKQTFYSLKLVTDYDHLGQVDRYIRDNTSLIDVKYDQNITFYFHINKNDYELAKEQLFQKNNFENKLEIIDESSDWFPIEAVY